MEVNSHRRERFGHRKEGTGRTATSRQFDLRGPRTGWQPPAEVKKDAHGFDDVDDFFGAGEQPAGGGSARRDARSSGSRDARGAKDTPNRTLDFSRTSPPPELPRPAQAPPEDTQAVFDNDIPEFSAGYDYGGPEASAIGHAGLGARQPRQDDSGSEELPKPALVKRGRKAGKAGKKETRTVRIKEHDEDEARSIPTDEEEDEDRGFRRRKGRRAVPKATSAASRTARRKPARSGHRSDDDEILGGDESSRRRDRRRESLHVGHGPEADVGIGGRYPQRRRWKRLEHWKGEHVVYSEEGALQAVKEGVLSPDLVPKRRSRSRDSRPRGDSTHAKEKSRRARSRSRGSDERPSRRAASRSRDPSEERAAAGRKRRREPSAEVPLRKAPAPELAEEELELARRGSRHQRSLSPSRLPMGFREATSPSLVVPSEDGQQMYQVAVFRQAKLLSFEKLPITTTRPPGLEKPALAAAAFDSSQFISGSVRMKPRAMKDEESTHNCTQVFSVISCQPKAVQIDIAGQSYLASPGDHFYVPQGTLYKLANHSPHTEAELSFVVIKPAGMGDAV